ncbi:MAG: hypothetical protein ACFFDT_38295, partial [Candidatus Hodarchaeota archaeon]
MEIEFNGITSNTLQEICNNHGVKAEVFSLASRDTICSREKGQSFGNGETYYLIKESCWHGYYWCGGYQCGRSSSYPSGRKRTSIRTRSRKETSKTSDCTYLDCSGSGDCDTSSDSSGAIIIFFLIIAVFLLLIFLAPIIGPMVALGI